MTSETATVDAKRPHGHARRAAAWTAGIAVALGALFAVLSLFGADDDLSSETLPTVRPSGAEITVLVGGCVLAAAVLFAVVYAYLHLQTWLRRPRRTPSI